MPLPDFTKWGEVERKPMSNIRRKTAEHLGHAWNAIPHVTQHDKADITALEELRKRYAPQAEKAGGKLTMTAIALKIVAAALQRVPAVQRVGSTWRANEIVYKKSIHVGVAADTPRGLLVPVIRDVDRKGIFELADGAGEGLREGARRQAVARRHAGRRLHDHQPRRHRRHVVHADRQLARSRDSRHLARHARSRSDNGQRAFEPRLMLPLSLSYDHRVIDGADAARFLRWVAEAFEQPFVLAL